MFPFYLLESSGILAEALWPRVLPLFYRGLGESLAPLNRLVCGTLTGLEAY